MLESLQPIIIGAMGSSFSIIDRRIMEMYPPIIQHRVNYLCLGCIRETLEEVMYKQCYKEDIESVKTKADIIYAMLHRSDNNFTRQSLDEIIEKVFDDAIVIFLSEIDRYKKTSIFHTTAHLSIDL